ncbi:hypothetical protein HGM15179_022483, partial [Zosterops borbonicus]
MTSGHMALHILALLFCLNTVQGKYFHSSTSVRAPGGSMLLWVLEVAAEENAETFSNFWTSWGPVVVSIHKPASSMDDRTYWQYHSAGDILNEAWSPLPLLSNFWTSWGPVVVSIHKPASSMDDRTYWQYHSAGDILNE